MKSLLIIGQDRRDKEAITNTSAPNSDKQDNEPVLDDFDFDIEELDELNKLEKPEVIREELQEDYFDLEAGMRFLRQSLEKGGNSTKCALISKQGEEIRKESAALREHSNSMENLLRDEKGHLESVMDSLLFSFQIFIFRYFLGMINQKPKFL